MSPACANVVSNRLAASEREIKGLGDRERGAGFGASVISALERLGFHSGAARESHGSGVQS